MKTKWTILMLFLTISNSFGAVGTLRELGGLDMSLKECQNVIKKLCGKEKELDKVLKCIKSHDKEIPATCLKYNNAFNK